VASNIGDIEGGAMSAPEEDDLVGTEHAGLGEQLVV
jgi:hypothetical protein